MRKKKQPPVPDRLEQEEQRLAQLAVEANQDLTLTAYQQLQVNLALTQVKRQGQIIRHLQEIEGQGWRR